MTTPVRIDTLAAPQPIAIVRRRASVQELVSVVPEACGAVWSALKAHGVHGAGRHVTVYLDGEINLEIGVEMPSPFSGAGEVIASAIPQGRVATATHFGPYQSLRETHRAIAAFCAANGHSTTSVSWEIYGHWDDAWDADPSKIRTDVFYLLV